MFLPDACTMTHTSKWLHIVVRIKLIRKEQIHQHGKGMISPLTKYTNKSSTRHKHQASQLQLVLATRDKSSHRLHNDQHTVPLTFELKCNLHTTVGPPHNGVTFISAVGKAMANSFHSQVI